jgi:uncharacterized membrane protein YkvA (DUF1232 family)
MPGFLDTWKEKAEELEAATYIVYLAARHPKTPWYAKTIALLTAAYAFSPIDLIPDFIPLLGYLDDLVIVPFGAWLALRLVPDEVLTECRVQAASTRGRDAPAIRWMALVVILIWVIVLLWLGLTLFNIFR